MEVRDEDNLHVDTIIAMLHKLKNSRHRSNYSHFSRRAVWSRPGSLQPKSLAGLLHIILESYVAVVA